MKVISTFVAIFACLYIHAQEVVKVKLLASTDLQIQRLVDIDNFGVYYFVNDNSFHKLDKTKDVTYSNLQLGKITSANAFNNLKINLFYKDFNTVMILDNRLAEITKIDFNSIQPYKNISHISTGFDTTLWVFNMDLQQLELFDYRTNKTKATAIPVQSNVLDIASNYNFCWLLTENFLYKYNYFGSVISKIKNEGFTEIEEDDGNVVIKANGKLFYLPKNSEEMKPIQLPELLINQFLVTNQTLYIYDSKKLHQYQLKID